MNGQITVVYVDGVVDGEVDEPMDEVTEEMDEVALVAGGVARLVDEVTRARVVGEVTRAKNLTMEA